MCEDKTVSGQDEINEKWIKPSDIAFFCFKERVGEFTKEELEVAVNEYQNNKFTPQIFVYIQDGKKDASLEEIMKKLEQKYRVFYFDFDDYAIKLRFAQNISQTLGGSGKVTAEGRKILIDDKPINLQIKHLSAIKNNEDYKFSWGTAVTRVGYAAGMSALSGSISAGIAQSGFHRPL